MGACLVSWVPYQALQLHMVPLQRLGGGLKRVRRSPLVYGPVTTGLHSCRKDRRMSWGNLATSHKSPLEISQLGFRNEFDCPAQISAITQQGENQSTVNNQTKIGRKPILNRKHRIVSACSKSPPHHPPHHVNRFPKILIKKLKRSESLAGLLFLKALNISSLYPQQELMQNLIFDVNDTLRALQRLTHFWLKWFWKSATSEKERKSRNLAHPYVELRAQRNAPLATVRLQIGEACHVGRT